MVRFLFLRMRTNALQSFTFIVLVTKNSKNTSMPRFRQVEGHWFYGHFYGHIRTKGYFNCVVNSCPYSLKIRFVLHNGKRIPSTVEKAVCSFHCHEFPNNSKNVNREIINEERKTIDSGEDVGGVLERKHREWQERA